MAGSIFAVWIATLLHFVEARDTAGQVQLVLTDAHNATFQGMHKSSYMPCIQDAHGDMFHHGLQFTGSNPTSALFSFEPPADGCYTIEEWHPGWNEQCNRYLMDVVLLQVTYGSHRQAFTYIEQSLNNGQWNMLGALPFKRGLTGHLMLKGTGASCREGNNCFWAADAFKLTKISDTVAGCTLPEQLLTPEQLLHADSRHPQVILDDGQVAIKDNWDFYLGVRVGGTPGKCGHQGWSNSFRYLNPKTSQDVEASLKFVFKPPMDGCYLVEEFHPVRMCSHELTSSAQLTIKYCRNKTARTAVDQTQGANQWNTVAFMPFYRGEEAWISVQHPQVGSGVVVADAFRFTKVADTCPQARPQLPQYLRLAQHPESVTIDDSTARIYGGLVPGAHQCDRTAYLGKIRAVNYLALAADFDFVPSSTGCYRVDEFHPEASLGCYLGVADVTVEHCLGKSWKGHINLHQDGGQWNTIGHFPFFAGIPGKVTSRPQAGSKAGEWVADAFRFTKVSDTCSTVPHSALLTLHVIGVDLKDVNLPDGKLTTNTDQRIAFHEAVIDVAGLPRSQVRLLGLRAGSIVAEFEFRGKEAEVNDAVGRVHKALLRHGPGSFEDRLCEASTVGGTEPKPCRAWMIRTTAVGGWSTTHVDEPMGILPLWAWIVIGWCGVAFLCCATLIPVALCRMKRRRDAKDTQSASAEEDMEATSKDVKDNISDSASTATPPERVSCLVQTEMSGDIFDLDALDALEAPELKSQGDFTDRYQEEF